MAIGGSYQPKDKDLTYIARALQSTATGVLKKTAADTWALDANLYAIGTITSPDGKFIVGTAGGWTSATITAAGLALLDDANATTQRTTLGLGTAATAAASDFIAVTTAKIPFYLASGDACPISQVLVAGVPTVPFYVASGSAANLPLVI